jgi:two-component system KDP operon response regulator KdpE
MTRVLVVDDEPQIVRALRINLRARQFEVHVAATGTEALRAAARYPPDLVLLDLGLPDLDGVEVIAGLRGWTDAPIIVLSGRSDATDKVDALDAGADDYVTKPFGMDELLARMRAVTRRVQPQDAEPTVTLGTATVDLAARRVTRSQNGTTSDVRLTPTEWHLIEVLLRHPGKLLSQRQLLTEVWGPGYADAGGNLPPVHVAAKTQARAGSVQAPLPAHRARHGLPLPARSLTAPRTGARAGAGEQGTHGAAGAVAGEAVKVGCEQIGESAVVGEITEHVTDAEQCGRHVSRA